MEQKYSIKGIEKIINKAGKERLAKYYGVDIDADFESIITNDLKKRSIPNGLEVALYFSIEPNEYNKEIKERKHIPDSQNAALEVYEQDGKQRAMFGFSYMGDIPKYDENDRSIMTSGTWGNILYFFVDEPINIKEVSYSTYSVGGVQFDGLIMGNAYYEAHKAELEDAYPDTNKIDAVDRYVENFMLEFENVDTLRGYASRQEYEETEEIRAEKAKNEKIILELTGKSSIDELSLKDFILLKRKLEKERDDLKQKFEEKFTKKDNEGRE